MSQQPWGSPGQGDSAAAAADCQTACDQACAMVHQLDRSELQNLDDDSDAFNRLVTDLEKVTFRFSGVLVAVW